MSDELKPCPFCGSTDLLQENNHYGWAIVQCEECGACGPCINSGRKAANLSWNGRSITEVVPAAQKTL